MKPIDDTISQTITLCRFPLIAIVVMLHSGVAYSVVSGGEFAYFCSKYFAGIAVPMFFSISAYLFFFRLTYASYKKKIVKRFRNLLVPYLFWNFTFIFAFFLLQCLAMGNVERKPIINWNIFDFLWAFWDVRHIQGYENELTCSPFYSHLWFLRDLFMMALLSPIFYYFLKLFKIYGVIVSLFVWFFLPFDCFDFMRNQSILFFLIGGYLQMFSKNILSYRDNKIKWWILGVAIVSMFSAYCLDGYFWSNILKKIYILSGCFCFFVFMSFVHSKSIIKRLSNLSDTTFFVYACHGIIVAPLSMVLLSVSKSNAFFTSVCFIATWIIALFVSLFLYKFGKRFCPWGLVIAAGNPKKTAITPEGHNKYYAYKS